MGAYHYRLIVAFCLRSPLLLRVGVSVMKTQLSNQKTITLNAINHAVFICYAA